MRNMRQIKLLLGGTISLLFIMGLSPAGASSANFSRSYNTSVSITNGSLVSLDPSRSNFVVPANSSNGQQLIGVAVAANDSLLAIDASASNGTVQVATSGTVNTLVSNVNGAIKVGDQISVSPFNGVGMKASPSAQVIGLAQTAFSETTVGGTPERVTDKNGKTSQILVGYIKLGIAVGSASTNTDGQFNSFQKFAKSLTGHTVSTFRAVISFIVAVVATLALVVLIYASIYGSIISIGRNPLAKYAVFRSLGSVLGMAALTALVASVTIFLLLR